MSLSLSTYNKFVNTPSIQLQNSSLSLVDQNGLPAILVQAVDQPLQERINIVTTVITTKALAELVEAYAMGQIFDIDQLSPQIKQRLGDHYFTLMMPRWLHVTTALMVTQEERGSKINPSIRYAINPISRFGYSAQFRTSENNAEKAFVYTYAVTSSLENLRSFQWQMTQSTTSLQIFVIRSKSKFITHMEVINIIKSRPSTWCELDSTRFNRSIQHNLKILNVQAEWARQPRCLIDHIVQGMRAFMAKVKEKNKQTNQVTKK